jgi:hypothetical protein
VLDSEMMTKQWKEVGLDSQLLQPRRRWQATPGLKSQDPHRALTHRTASTPGK